MSNQRKAERREEIQLVREEAVKAFHAGKSIHSCPYRNCNERQWKEAYIAESQRVQTEEIRSRKVALIQQIAGIKTKDDLQNCLMQIVEYLNLED